MTDPLNALDREPSASTRRRNRGSCPPNVAGSARSALSPEGAIASPALRIEGLSRRSFIRLSASLSGALVAAGIVPRGLVAGQLAATAGSETVVPTGDGRSLCGGNCVIKAVVRDFGTPGATIVRIETDDQPDIPGTWQLRACARGRAIRKHVYSPDRVKYPMKRKNWSPGGGANVQPELRGRDEWVRISWDEAASFIAAEMVRLKDAYGNEAFHDLGQSGSTKMLHGRAWVQRLFNRFGGYTAATGSYSFPGCSTAHRYLWGLTGSQHDFWDLLNADHALFWSFNPVAMGQQAGADWYLTLVKEKFEQAGKRMVLVDPWFNRTGQAFADEWVPIRFQTDEAMMLAMLHVLFTDPIYSTKIDEAWIEARSVGIFPRTGSGTMEDPTIPPEDCLKYYVLGWDSTGRPATDAGHKNFPPKTPAWASRDTGVPAETITHVAKEYADNSVFMGTGKKAAFYTGWGMNRRAYGENPYILATAIATITKNIGVSGGGPGFTHGGSRLPAGSTGAGPGKNPIAGECTFDVANRALAIAGKPVRNESTFAWRSLNIRMLWGACGNVVNQNNDLNRTLQAIHDRIECFVVSEIAWSVSAQHADIVLPICTSQEVNDINAGYQLSPQMVFMNKCVEPLFESKTDMEACKLVADKLGIGKGFVPDTEDNMLRAVWEGTSSWNGGMTYEEFKAAGVAKYDRWAKPTVFLEDFIANPATGGPRPEVPSGKIEFYSTTIAKLLADGKISAVDTRPIPTYPPRIEGPGDPIMARYPLAAGQPASFKRSHSTHANLPWVKEMAPEEDGVIMHPDDAGVRGIRTGDRVRVWNDRGEMWVTAYVSNTVARGCVITPRGSWYRPTRPGTIGCPSDGGGASVLTGVGKTGSLNVGSASGSCAVQIAKL
ncbi:MAG: molybdopterin-dependent oxidoreductase [Acidobacteriota bacterium]